MNFRRPIFRWPCINTSRVYSCINSCRYQPTWKSGAWNSVSWNFTMFLLISNIVILLCIFVHRPLFYWFKTISVKGVKCLTNFTGVLLIMVKFRLIDMNRDRELNMNRLIYVERERERDWDEQVESDSYKQAERKIDSYEQTERDRWLWTEWER